MTQGEAGLVTETQGEGGVDDGERDGGGDSGRGGVGDGGSDSGRGGLATEGEMTQGEEGLATEGEMGAVTQGAGLAEERTDSASTCK